MTHRQFSRLAGLFSILSDPARLRILQSLRGEALCVGDISRRSRLKQANTSKHLRLLREAGIVSSERHGTTILYQITEPLVIELCDLVCGKRRWA